MSAGVKRVQNYEIGFFNLQHCVIKFVADKKLNWKRLKVCTNEYELSNNYIIHKRFHKK